MDVFNHFPTLGRHMMSSVCSGYTGWCLQLKASSPYQDFQQKWFEPLDQFYGQWKGSFPSHHRLSGALPSNCRAWEHRLHYTERNWHYSSLSVTPKTRSDEDIVTSGSASLFTWPLAASKAADQTILCLIGCTGGQGRDLGSNRPQISL